MVSENSQMNTLSEQTGHIGNKAVELYSNIGDFARHLVFMRRVQETPSVPKPAVIFTRAVSDCRRIYRCVLQHYAAVRSQGRHLLELIPVCPEGFSPPDCGWTLSL